MSEKKVIVGYVGSTLVKSRGESGRFQKIGVVLSHKALEYIEIGGRRRCENSRR